MATITTSPSTPNNPGISVSPKDLLIAESRPEKGRFSRVSGGLFFVLAKIIAVLGYYVGSFRASKFNEHRSRWQHGD